MKNKILLLSFVLTLVFGLAIFQKAQAAPVTGWLWGGGAEPDGVAPWDGTNTNVGWISANRLNCDSNGDGTTDTGNYANCPVGLPVTTDNNYRLDIPSSGNVTGYAWSENIGWIDFNPPGPYPAAPNSSATKNGDYLEGWARIMSIPQNAGNNGGWEGWIKMKGSNYGVQISKMDGTGNNPTYAWSDELGWIDFSRAKIDMTLKICSSCDAGGIDLSAGITMLIIDPDKQISACWVPGTSTNCEGSDVTNDPGTTWNSDNTSVITLPSKGWLRPVAAGSSLVTATYNSKNASTLVTVIAACTYKRCNDATYKCDFFETITGTTTCSDKCTTDSECAPKPANWKEVAP